MKLPASSWMAFAVSDQIAEFAAELHTDVLITERLSGQQAADEVLAAIEDRPHQLARRA